MVGGVKQAPANHRLDPQGCPWRPEHGLTGPQASPPTGTHTKDESMTPSYPDAPNTRFTPAT
jgi:hypothetical protein